MYNVLAVIPARGGSKGIPFKNLLKIKNKSLIQIAIQEAKKSSLINKLIFSSDHNKLINEAKKFIEVEFKRPARLATDRSSSYDVARHALDYYEKTYKKKADYIVLLPPTTPFRTSKDIDDSIKKLIKNKNFDSLVAVTNVNYPPFWMLKKKKNQKIEWLFKNIKKYNTRQEFPKVFQPNGMIYIIKRSKLLTMRGILPQNKTMGFFVDEEKSVNIDNFEQYKFAKFKKELKI